MVKNSFKNVAAYSKNVNWGKLVDRQNKLYERKDDVRSPFARDYTRILHSMAYRRLKHKTQVFYNIENDHICTRVEHVTHVESVSSTIAKYLGLNDELTKAIVIGHDLGHAPFGHQGENIIKQLYKAYLGENFWHEKNGLRFIDKIELLEDNYKMLKNLNLTYAVRDGIISHCGEVDENGLIPRDYLIPLDDFNLPGQYQPATWEGCVVKISDKIAYIGRDIEDAINLGFLDEDKQSYLLKMARTNDQTVLNTTVIMHNLIINICENSSLDKGIYLDSNFLDQLNELKRFNYEYIYKNKRLVPFQNYSELVLTQIFTTLLELYDGKHTWNSLEKVSGFYPVLIDSFQKWLARYCDPTTVPKGVLKELALLCENEKIYFDLNTEDVYKQAILDYISGMTDRFAIKVFQELLTY